jgi:hypothetical protein
VIGKGWHGRQSDATGLSQLIVNFFVGVCEHLAASRLYKPSSCSLSKFSSQPSPFIQPYPEPVSTFDSKSSLPERFTQKTTVLYPFSMSSSSRPVGDTNSNEATNHAPPAQSPKDMQEGGEMLTGLVYKVPQNPETVVMEPQESDTTQENVRPFPPSKSTLPRLPQGKAASPGG